MRNYLAEAIGTFALVFVGIGAIWNSSENLLIPAFAHGLTVAVMVFALGRVSGAHINPAVTLTLLIDGRIEFSKAIGYIISQLIGATAASLLAWPVFSLGAVELGAPVIGPGFDYGRAFIVEFVGTFFLLTVIYGTAVVPDKSPMAGLAIGLTVTAGIFLAGPISGAAFNPARAFGPALTFIGFHGVTGTYTLADGVLPRLLDQTVYWLGPVTGAIAGGLLYSKVWMSDEESVASKPAPVASTQQELEDTPVA